jgi:uncharacterized protein YcbK (DUF882 family)
MSLAKGLLKVTHDVLAEHIAEGVAKYVKAHITEILPKTLNQLDELYDVSKKNEDFNVMSNNKGSYYYKHTVEKNAEKVIAVKGHHTQHVMCKSMDYQIVVNGVSYTMTPIQMEDRNGNMIKMLAYVQSMMLKDDEEHLKLVVNEK